MKATAGPEYNEEDIRRSIRAMVADMVPFQTVWGTVTAVDWEAKECTVEVDGVEWHEVLLSIDGGEWDVKKPKVGTPCLVGTVQNQEGQGLLLFAKEYEEWLLNGDANGGIAIAPELKAQLDKNNLLLNSILTVLNGAPVTEPGNGAPSALQLALKSAVAGKQVGDFSKIESKTIKHG